MRVKGKDGPREAPGSKTGLAASMEPLETRSHKFIGGLIHKGEKGQCSCIKVRRHWLAVYDPISRVPSSVRTGAVEQHFDSAPDAEVKQVTVLLGREMS